MKYILGTLSILLLLIIIAGGAFYFGQQSANQSKEMTTTPTPSPYVTAQIPTGQLMQEETKDVKTIKAGGVLVLSPYSIVTPSDWASQKEQGEEMDKLTISKEGYKITIFQGSYGGGGCIYSGEPYANFTKYDNYVEIQNPNGFVFRRGQNQSTGKTSWTVCQKGADDSYGTITSFGLITINNPLNIDEEIMSETDQILASLKKF
ncbi:MAG: hypothetical protein AAB532_04180 [Patescibacteria group bacterium]